MIPSHSSLLNVYDVVDNRRIQLGLLLNLIDENIDGWSSFTKVVKENHGIFYSNNNRMQEDSLKKITAIVEKVFLERSIEENMEVNFMLQKLEILGHFPIHSFRRVEKILLVCYLIAILSSTNQADISEKACCLLVCALDSGDKTYPILTYFDPNSVLPWLIRKGKILDNPKVLKAVFEVFTEIAAKSLGNMENFSGFSKEESTDLSQMAGALFLENLRKGQKRLKKSPNKATADKILKSIIKSFQKSLKAPPQLFVDMGNSTKNCTLLSICSSILRVYTEAKQTEKLKAKTILNRLPRILSIAYRGIESGSEEWAEASKELFDIVLVHRKKLARKTPSNVMSKLWEAHKKSTHENRWHDGTLKIICSIVKKVALEKICNDIVLGLRYAVETRNMSQFKKYNHFLCQIMQARIAPGPREEVRCLALQKCFSLISTCSTAWEEKEDILQSSLVILGSYRALIGSQTVFLSPFELSLCLEAIIRVPFKICDTVPEFFSIFLASFKILHGFLTKHEEIAADRMPSVLRCFSILLSATIYRFHQGKNLTDTELKSGIICAEKLGNIGEVMADQKLRFRRVAPYIIAEMLEHFQKFTLYPLIREQLAHGVYGLMSILDKPAVSQLLVTLSSGPREVFKMEYETYVKYRKYSGKV
ncbi:uncharacterized protein LOC136027083 isoform X1 [Artemia franciscana]|uniref:uncharacterized protein LOC136027083 isoform X1 n=1 Tax=Artemia franciscana TaxID=6661 RepID=UPI0032DAB4C9